MCVGCLEEKMLGKCEGLFGGAWGWAASGAR